MASLENFRLVVFRAVARQRSFRKAAEELYLTQPAVSLQIKALEEDLGVQLFDRSGSQIQLTREGQILQGYADRSAELLASAAQEIASAAGEHAGRLALGASTTIAQYVLPKVLGELRKSYPLIAPTLISGNTEDIVQLLEEQKIDVGCIEGPARSREIFVEPFLLDELVMIVPAAHEWAERGQVQLKDIPAVPLLMRERGSGTRDVVERELERHGLKRRALQVVMELDSTEAIKSAVEAGLGVGFVSRWALAKDSRLGASVKVIDVAGLKIRRDFFLARRAGPEPQGIVAEFRRFLLRSLEVQRTERSKTKAADKKGK